MQVREHTIVVRDETFDGNIMSGVGFCLLILFK